MKGELQGILYRAESEKMLPCAYLAKGHCVAAHLQSNASPILKHAKQEKVRMEFIHGIPFRVIKTATYLTEGGRRGHKEVIE
jgi:hypothetical protein